MPTPTLTHYAPWADAADQALCGHLMTPADLHMTSPTCPACVALLAAEEAFEALLDDELFPLDADEAARELDPLLNAGLPVPTASQPSLFADDLFAFAVSLNRAYAEVRR